MDPFVLEVKPQWLALACIHVSLQCYGLNVPGSVEGGKTWYEVRHTWWCITYGSVIRHIAVTVCGAGILRSQPSHHLLY